MSAEWGFKCPDHQHAPDETLTVLPVAIDWVITHNATDFPDKVVVRRHAIGHGPGGDTDLHMIVAKEPSAVVDTVAQARAVIPEGAEFYPRCPLDEPVIVEVWRVYY